MNLIRYQTLTIVSVVNQMAGTGMFKLVEKFLTGFVTISNMSS